MSILDTIGSKLWIAIAIFLGGFGFAAWSLVSSRPTPPPRPERAIERTPVERDPRVEAMITGADYRVIDTPDLLEALDESLRRELVSQRHTNLNDAQRADLKRAVIARFRNLYSPDLETNLRDLRSRGMKVTDERASELHQSYLSWHRVRPIDTSSVTIRSIHGKVSIDSPAGYQTVTHTIGKRFGLPQEPALNGYTALEIAVAIKDVEPMSGDRQAVLAGYRFVWNPGLGKWVPYASVVHRPSGKAAAALPF